MGWFSRKKSPVEELTEEAARRALTILKEEDSQNPSAITLRHRREQQARSASWFGGGGIYGGNQGGMGVGGPPGWGYRAAYYGRGTPNITVPESLTGLPWGIRPMLFAVRARAHQLGEDNPIARALLDRASENVVGTGFKHQAMSSDVDWNNRVDDYMEGAFQTIDFQGRSWLKHQKLVARGRYWHGDIGSVMLKTGQLRLIGSEYIQTKWSEITGNRYDGVEYDKYGRVKNYSVLYFDPNAMRWDWQKVSAQYFAFTANTVIPLQQRGTTYFAQIFDYIEMLDRLCRATSQMAVLSAILGIFVEKNSPADVVSGMYQGTSPTGKSEPIEFMESSRINYMGIGEKINFNRPEQPGEHFADTVATFMRLIGLPFGLPLEFVLLDSSRSNFSTTRNILIQAQKAIGEVQTALIDEYYRKIYLWRLRRAIDNEEIEDREDWDAHRWLAPRPKYLDPVKEAQAHVLEFGAGMDNIIDYLHGEGLDPEAQIAKMGNARKMFADNGVPVYRSSFLAQDAINGAGSGSTAGAGAASSELGGSGSNGSGSGNVLAERIGGNNGTAAQFVDE